jgi:hypothetical protein
MLLSSSNSSRGHSMCNNSICASNSATSYDVQAQESEAAAALGRQMQHQL